MLYFRLNDNRIIFVNEYVILAPLVILSDIIIIRHVKKQRARAKELEELKRRIKLYKMTLISVGSVTGALLINTYRGGENEKNFIDVSDITCGIEEGFSYVDNIRIRKILTALYCRKAQNGVIFVTGAAICQIAKIYGVNFPALLISIQDFGITSMVQTIRKTVVASLVLVGFPMVYLQTTIMMMMTGTTLIGLAMMLASYRLDFIPTTPIDEPIVQKLERRIPTVIDVIAVNIENMGRASKITKPECNLPIQNVMNRNCKSNVIYTPVYEKLLNLNIDWTKVVTMKDVTGLEKVTFSDEFVFQAIPRKEKLVQPKPKARIVTFAEKFKDRCFDDDLSTDEADTPSLRGTSRQKIGIKITEKLDDLDPD